MKHIRIAVLILCACFASAAWAQQSAANPLNNWSEFLRTNMQRYNPAETTLSLSNVPDLQTKWFYPLGTDTLSSAVVANGVVYVQTLGDDGGSVVAVKGGAGSSLWSNNNGGGSESTPAVANGVLYFGNYFGVVQALNASTGAFLWASNQVGDYITSSPAVANGLVFVGVSFDGTGSGGVTALRASNGNQVWFFPTNGDVESSPAVVGSVVYVGSDDNNVYALSTRGAKLWSYTTGGAVQSSPAVANGVVYIGSQDGNLYALNATTGAKLWSYTTGGRVNSSPAVANGVVYVGSADGNLYALNATTGALLWSYTTAGTVSSSPAVANGVVYIGAETTTNIGRDNNGNNLYALNAATGALLWSYVPDIPAAETSAYSPTVANGQVYFGSNYGHSLVAFGLK